VDISSIRKHNWALIFLLQIWLFNILHKDCLFAIFIFIFLSSCSVALSSPWASSRTVVEQHFTLPSHSWCIDPNTLLLHHNLSQSEFSRSLHANTKGKCSPCTCCPWLPNITTSSTSGSGLAIKQNFQWCFCLESYFASPRHLSLALKQLTQVLIFSAQRQFARTML